jgi:hypothetical protein
MSELNTGKMSVEESVMSVYPNPVQDQINIKFEWEDTQETSVGLRVLDRSGRIVLQQRIPTQVGQNIYQLNLSTLPQGLFMIQLQGAQYLGKQRFIKTQ